MFSQAPPPVCSSHPGPRSAQIEGRPDLTACFRFGARPGFVIEFGHCQSQLEQETQFGRVLLLEIQNGDTNFIHAPHAQEAEHKNQNEQQQEAND